MKNPLLAIPKAKYRKPTNQSTNYRKQIVHLDQNHRLTKEWE